MVNDFLTGFIVILENLLQVGDVDSIGGREFNRRLKKLFDEKEIEILFPHRTLLFANQRTKQAEKIANQT
ncbi:MAG: small-conductance mechanosensitive channel [Pseudohongiellaceae bacterium]|jgi:small-conductance mechanosensitive channel